MTFHSEVIPCRVLTSGLESLASVSTRAVALTEWASSCSTSLWVFAASRILRGGKQEGKPWTWQGFNYLQRALQAPLGWLLPQIIGLSMEWSRILVRLTGWFFFFSVHSPALYFPLDSWLEFSLQKRLKFVFGSTVYLISCRPFLSPLGYVIRFLNSMDYHPV